MKRLKIALVTASMLALTACGRMPALPTLDANHPASPEAAAAPVSTPSVLKEQPATPVPAAPAPAQHIHHQPMQHEEPGAGEMHHDH